jgi:large subunit ribosomal protein L2
MAIQIVRRKPRNASLRFQSYMYNDEISKRNNPEKSLVTGNKKRTGGRNSYGRITTRHIGGGADRKYRIIDFTRSERAVAGKVTSLQYDPNRNVPIALVVYPNGNKQYMLLAEGISVGSVVAAGPEVEATLGNHVPLRTIPVGFFLHNIEIRPNSGGKLVRSAGLSAQLMAKEGDYATIKMPSGEMRLLHLDCYATIGVLAHGGYRNIVIGKAGRNRNRGIRPSVRGMAMNPVDHPRGGGEGRSKSGSRPVSPWGKCSQGTKTRAKRRQSRFILKRRK